VARVYLLIKVESGKENDVYEAVRKLPYVKMADIVTGPLDIVVVFETENLSKAEEIILTQVRKIEGIKETTTLIALTD